MCKYSKLSKTWEVSQYIKSWASNSISHRYYFQAVIISRHSGLLDANDPVDNSNTTTPSHSVIFSSTVRFMGWENTHVRQVLLAA